MLSSIREKLSYIYPITRKVSSSYNGVLEITYLNGKKLLNTKNTNYSFGSLHKVMLFALNRVPLKEKTRVLLLGLGGGSAIKIIREDFHKQNPIDVVDIDPQIIDIAKKEFGVDNYSGITIYCQNAFNFVEEINQKYGLIIIDLFIDNHTPDYFYSRSFWDDVLMISKKKCCIIFNTLTVNNSPDNINIIHSQLTKAKFQVFIYPNIEVSNTILIAKRS